MRTQQSRPIGVFPSFDAIQDEATKKFAQDLANLLLKQHRDITDDIKNAQNLDTVDSLPTPTAEYRGRLVVLKGSGTGADKVYLGIDTGSSGFAFKQITI